MKQTRFYPLLILSVIFLLISVVMLGILGYNLYQQTEDRKAMAAGKLKTIKKVVNPVIDRTRDSLQKMYAATVTSFRPDTLIDAAFKTTDPAQVNLLDNKLTDYYKLRNEISTLLKDNSSIADLDLARDKIKELQVKLEELKIRNIDIENENKRLHALLDQLSRNNNTTAVTDIRSTDVALVKAAAETNSSAVFSATELKLAAANDNNAEVASAEETEKFVGSFVVRNSLTQGSSEVMLVLIQPDGKVLRNAWESGSFDTDGGKKIYSRKIKFDYTKGEARLLNFSVPLDNCQKGTYTLQLYSRGKVIGKAIKTVG